MALRRIQICKNTKQITEKPGLAAGRYKDCVGNTSSGGGTQNTTDETKDKNPGRESQ